MKYTVSRPKKAALLLFSVAVLLASFATIVRAQSALDGFDPNANGAVRVVTVQPDGKILIGGNFTTVLGIARNRIARLNVDGTLDELFNPDANADVFAIAVQADGRVLVGGSFNGTSSIGGQPRNYMARLNARTGAADSFNANANETVYSIAVQTDGKILAGGNFTSIGGTNRNYIARLDATGFADSFNPNANSAVIAIAVQADGKILAGGNFNGTNSIGGQTRNFIARLDANTGLADLFNPNANASVYSIAVQADGKILAGGFFNGANSIGGEERNYIARLDATTGLADTFNPDANAIVRSIAVQADGQILAGGLFTSIGGQTRNRIGRLVATTGSADSFNPAANDAIYAIAVQPDGKILAVGNFLSIGGQTRNRIARLERDGSIDRNLNLGAVGSSVYATAVQPDGKILIAGTFTSILGVPRTNIARLNTDGTLDSAFVPSANEVVFAIAVQLDGKILVGGFFTAAGGQPRNRIARLNATNGLADSFNPNADNTVNSIALQADGKILVGGDFTVIGGEDRNRMARLDPETGFPDSFEPNVNGQIYSMVVEADGRILVGGFFNGANSIAGATRNYIARLNQDGTIDNAFNPNASGVVAAIAVQSDGKILVGGRFNGTNSIGSQTRNFIARLNATNGLADSFNPDANNFVASIAVQADGYILVGGGFDAAFPAISIGGETRRFCARLDPTNGLAYPINLDANGTVGSMALQEDGKILEGGSFGTIAGQPRLLFARLNNDIGAWQDLAATQTTITWTRGGSSPQFTRATFEYSTNNVNYTPLGNATMTSSNWTLTGLNLATGQNIYIRARGHYRSGYQNASESIAESVRNVFIVARPRLNIQRSANTNVVLSWATNFTGFKLEANTNLNANVWSVVSAAPAVSGTNNVVTNTVSGAARYYRLRQ